MSDGGKYRFDAQRPPNIEYTYQYFSPFGSSDEVRQTTIQEAHNVKYEAITGWSGKGPKAYAGTKCGHTTHELMFVEINGSDSTSVEVMNYNPPYDYGMGSLHKRVSGALVTPLPTFVTPTAAGGRSFDDCVHATMKRMLQTGGFGKPPKSVGLGETLGEIGLSAGRLTETLLNLSPPIPRPPGRWDIWTPAEIAEFRTWKDVFHPLEILFGLYPVAEQVTELALNAADKAQGYAYKMEKWIKKLKKSSSPYRATIREIEGTEDFDPDPSEGWALHEMNRTCTEVSWLTGIMSCRDYTEFTVPYDIITYYNENWAITMWDLTSYSYLFDRFTGGAVKKMLKAAIDASNHSSGGAFKRNETTISIYNNQIHRKLTAESKWKASVFGSFGGSGTSRQQVYTRTWPDEIGAITEDANPAEKVLDLFRNTPKPLNGWTPTQYMDVLFLFIPPVVLKSS